MANKVKTDLLHTRKGDYKRMVRAIEAIEREGTYITREGYKALHDSSMCTFDTLKENGIVKFHHLEKPNELYTIELYDETHGIPLSAVSVYADDSGKRITGGKYYTLCQILGADFVEKNLGFRKIGYGRAIRHQEHVVYRIDTTEADKIKMLLDAFTMLISEIR